MSDNKEKPKRSGLRAAANFGIGGVAGCCAISALQPVDIVKVRIQLLDGQGKSANTNPFSVAKSLMAEGGFKVFYKGIDSAFAR